jgi:phenylalanyl-tRNA synthetase alpha chain
LKQTEDGHGVPCPYRISIMTSSENKTTQTLAQLGISSAEQITPLFAEIQAEFDADASKEFIEVLWKEFRDQWLGRKSGILSRITDNWLKPASPELKRSVGAGLNQLRAHVEAKIEERRLSIEANEEQWTRAHDHFDLSLPGVTRPVGSHHLIRQVFQEIEDIFVSIGFSVVEGPEIETPYYNFEALNIPEFHPVRDDMDTFYIELPKGAPSPLLLRTHTSPMQIRTMEKRQPPIRVIVPGKVYRRDNPDATHSFAFHQVEGLAVDTDITFCDFTGTIEYFVKQFFGPGVKTRFRPSYFPFTEPSVEFDVTCVFCGGSGVSAGGGTCSKCKGAGWIELFGAGMVDPAVYGFVGYDAKKVSGFAFGIGIDRLAMLKYGIDDIQVFFQSDVRFLRQFP